MTSLSARRVAACVASAAAMVAVVPATASAKKGPVTDRGEQCSGSNIVGRGSTFQNPAQLVWNPGFNKNTSSVACSGTQGSKGTPKAEYRNTLKEDRGSGACLKAFGAEKVSPNRTYDYCGTDEAPNVTQKSEIESHKEGEAEKSLETIPVAQGAEAIIVHLPEGCRASSEVESKGKKYKLGRLVFDNSTIDAIYRGLIGNWKQAIEVQGAGHGNDSLSCTGGTAEEETAIKPVVRLDHSGTTHIFKAYLSLANPAPFEAEPYEEEYFGSSTGCGTKFPAEAKTWGEVAEACQNQRWPEAAHVVRPEESGNPGVVNKVNSTPSSIGYADLAVAREFKFFSAKGQGGENKKGSATKQGEQNTKFWAEVQNKSSPITYADPSSDGDVEKLGNSNCKNTSYINSSEEEFPPESTRDLWNGAKAALNEEHYAICGLTYDLAYKLYKPYFGAALTDAQGIALATGVENYLMYEISGKGGGKDLKNKDYEQLPKAVIKEAEAGIQEIGWAISE